MTTKRKVMTAEQAALPRRLGGHGEQEPQGAQPSRLLKIRGELTAFYSPWTDDVELPLAEILQAQPRTIQAAGLYLLDMSGINEEKLGELLAIIKSNQRNGR